MATNYKTLTFSGANQVWSADEPGSAVYFADGKIYLFYVVDAEGSSPSLMYIYANATSDLSAQASWSSAMSFSSPFTSDSATPAPTGAPSTVATADTLYVFWCDKSKKVLGCSALGWRTSVKILDAHGAVIDTSNREVAACLVGKVILVATTDNSENAVYYYTLRPEDLDASSGQWKAHQSIKIAQNVFVNNGDPMSKSISITSSVAYKDGATIPLLVQTLQFSKAYYIFVMTLDPQTSLPTGQMLEKVKIGDGMTGGMMLARDPAGRVRYYYGDDDAYVRGGLVSFCNGEQYQITIGASSKLFGDSKTTATPPAGTFVPVLTDGSGSTQRWTAREVVFHDENTGTDADKVIKLQVADYGTIRKTINPSRDLTTSDNKVQLVGYILSPPPLPVQNYTHKTFNFPFNAATLSYGKTSSGTKENQTTTGGSIALGVGVSAGVGVNIMDILDTGITVGAEVEVTFGMETTTRMSHGATSAMNLDATWEVMVGEEGQPEYYGQGFALYRNIVIGSSTYDFTDEGQGSPATNAYVNMLFEAQDTTLQVAPFRTWLVDPSDLSTYTETAYTSSMSGAGLYSGNNYIQDFVAPNAIKYDPTAGKYTSNGQERGLPFAWGSGATVMPEYTEVDTSFTESAWTLDTRTYVSAEADFSLIGEASAKVWSQLTTSMRSVSSEELSTGWGIKLAIDVPVPETSGVEDPIYAYTGTMYFCPPPSTGSVAGNQWTTELLSGLEGGVTDFSQAMSQHKPWDQTGLARKIDPKSQCWKICFTIANVYQGSTHVEELVTPKYLTASTAKQLKAKGLTTVGKAAQTLGVKSMKDLEASAIDWLNRRAGA